MSNITKKEVKVKEHWQRKSNGELLYRPPYVQMRPVYDRSCNTPDCDRKARSLGLCKKCYDRWFRHQQGAKSKTVFGQPVRERGQPVETDPGKPVRTCLKCGRVLGATAKLATEYCSLNPECKREADRERKRKLREAAFQKKIAARKYGGHNGRKWLIEDDDYIDPVAVHLATKGIRKVTLTSQERVECVKQMLKMHALAGDMINRLGVSTGDLRKILDGLGWEIIPDPMVSMKKHVIIVRKDRPTTKTLDSGQIDLGRPYTQDRSIR